MSDKIELLKDVELGASGDIIKEGRFLFNRKTGKLFFDDLDKRVLLNPTSDWNVEKGPGEILNRPETYEMPLTEEMYNKLERFDLEYISGTNTLNFIL